MDMKNHSSMYTLHCYSYQNIVMERLLLAQYPLHLLLMVHLEDQSSLTGKGNGIKQRHNLRSQLAVITQAVFWNTLSHPLQISMPHESWLRWSFNVFRASFVASVSFTFCEKKTTSQNPGHTYSAESFVMVRVEKKAGNIFAVVEVVMPILFPSLTAG